jgi:hypothetical protein
MKQPTDLQQPPSAVAAFVLLVDLVESMQCNSEGQFMGEANRRKKPKLDQLADDLMWKSDVRPLPHFEKGVRSIYGLEIENSFIGTLNQMSTDIGDDHEAQTHAALQAAVDAGMYLAYTLQHGGMRTKPLDPVADAAAVIAAGFLTSQYNKGDRTLIKAGDAPFGIEVGVSRVTNYLDEANRQRNVEHFFAPCILTGMLKALGHYVAFTGGCEHCMEINPQRQLLLIRSVIRLMSVQYEGIKDRDMAAA